MVCLRPSAGEQLLGQAQGVLSHPAMMWESSTLLGMSEPNLGSAAIDALHRYTRGLLFSMVKIV